VYLADLSIRRPVMAVMVVGALVVLGWISLGRVGVDLFPPVEFPYVAVETRLEGAAPETVESEITDKIEEEVNATAGIESLRSTSSEGLSLVMIEFGLDEDADTKAQDVRERIDLALDELPAEAEKPVIRKVDPDADPILTVMLAGDAPIRELTEFAERDVKERLQRIPGVGGVQRVGGLEREIRIWLDAHRLRSYGLTVDEVVNAIRREHQEIPGGRLETAGGRRELSVKTLGEVERVEGFGEIVVAQRGAATVRVRDVARIEDGMEDERSWAELDGVPGVALQIRRQSGRNTVEVARAVEAELARIEAELPPGLRITLAKDVSRFIESSIDDVMVDILLGVGLVVVVTLCFLLSVRATIVVALAIPTSIVATFFMFWVMDFTVNMLTLMALGVSIGLLVDDAIVVLESVFRRIEQGEDRAMAASVGTEQVGGAIVAGSLAVMGVFAPIAFMEGIVGRFFYQYGLTIVIAVAVSLFVSVTLTPMLCARVLRATDGQAKGIFAVLDAAYGVVERRYERWLRFALSHRPAILVGALAAVVVGGWFAGQIPVGFDARTDRSEYTATVELPLGTGIQESKEIGRRAQQALAALEHTQLVFMSIGSGAEAASNLVEFYVAITPKQERAQTQRELMDGARRALTDAIPEARAIRLGEIPWIGGTGMTQADFQIALRGPELSVLEERSSALMEGLRATGHFTDIDSTYQAGKPEVHVALDRARAADLGISAQALALAVRTLVGGEDVTTFEEGGDRFDVRARLEESDRDRLAALDLIQVRAGDGTLVDLANVADVTVASGPTQVNRLDRARTISVYANAAVGVAVGEAKLDSDRLLAALELPPGYTVRYDGASEQIEKSAQAVVFALGLAVVALYMILASQFDSFGQPLVIMATAPLSWIGAFVLLALTGGELTLWAQIGLVALMGLVMKNGILLVDYANQVRAQDPMTTSPSEAMLRAGRLRLRPVLMTAFSTISGMIPVALSDSDGSEMRFPMGVIVIGGLASSTLLTLFVVPVIYTYYLGLLRRGAALLDWVRMRGAET
jgi:HAE1 family hydrophobic/amphiphilic exporter-1